MVFQKGNLSNNNFDCVEATIQEVGSGKSHTYKLNADDLCLVIDLLESLTEEDDDDSDILLPCPFCGSSCTAYETKDGKWYVSCNYCGVATPDHFFTYDQAEDFWNDREDI